MASVTKTILLEKQYLYVRASKGFILKGTSTERIWTNTGYYRFLVDNVAKSLGNSYVDVIYDSDDTDFIAYCSDLFMEEIQNTVVVAVENMQSVLEDFKEQNHEDITDLSEGLSGALEIIASEMQKSSFYPVDIIVDVGSNIKNYTINDTIDVGDSKVVSYNGFLISPTDSKCYFVFPLGKYFVLFPDGQVSVYNQSSSSSKFYCSPFGGVFKLVRYE